MGKINNQTKFWNDKRNYMLVSSFLYEEQHIIGSKDIGIIIIIMIDNLDFDPFILYYLFGMFKY